MFGLSVGRSVRRLVDLLVVRSVGLSLASRSFYRSVGLCVWRSFGWSASHFVDKSVYMLVDLSVCRSCGVPVCRSDAMSVCWSISVLVCRSVAPSVRQSDWRSG